jgi:hypothetical protein
MAGTEYLLRRIHSLEGQIEALEEYAREAESYPPQVDLPGRVRRALWLFFLRREVARKVYDLRLRRDAALACYRHHVPRPGAVPAPGASGRDPDRREERRSRACG